MSENATPHALVSAEWALEHLEDSAVRFVEVSLDTAVYDGTHIPGAISWNWKTQLAHRLRRDVVDPAELGALLSSTGVGPDARIVLYGDNYNWIAAWAYWQLKLYRLEKVSLLDGGRKYWTDHFLPVLVTVITHPSTSIRVSEPDFSIRASRDDILSRLGDARLSLVDVRSPAEFEGRLIAPTGARESAQRAGHIPGAVSAPWEETLNADGTFKSADALRRQFAAKGVTADKDVITYGRIGEHSAHSWFVLHELLGLPSVRNYDGSWVEWGSLVGAPIENPAGG